MTSPNRRLSLEEVLDEFYFSVEKPSPVSVLRVCETHPEYREDILEFAALWSSYEASPEPTSIEILSDVSEESVSRLQSYVLNHLHELDQKPVPDSDVEAARKVDEGLAGARLKRAAVAAGLGESTLLLTKVLTKRITDVPSKVMNDLARHLNVVTRDLRQCLGLGLAGSMSYKASDKPIVPTTETWESAVRTLPVSDAEKIRLIELQRKDDHP